MQCPSLRHELLLRFNPRIPSTNIGPRISMPEMSKVDSDTSLGTRCRNGGDRRTSETMATIFWDPKQEPSVPRTQLFESSLSAGMKGQRRHLGENARQIGCWIQTKSCCHLSRMTLDQTQSCTAFKAYPRPCLSVLPRYGSCYLRSQRRRCDHLANMRHCGLIQYVPSVTPQPLLLFPHSRFGWRCLRSQRRCCGDALSVVKNGRHSGCDRCACYHSKLRLTILSSVDTLLSHLFGATLNVTEEKRCRRHDRS
jgi:hypothetical protein